MNVRVSQSRGYSCNFHKMEADKHKMAASDFTLESKLMWMLQLAFWLHKYKVMETLTFVYKKDEYHTVIFVLIHIFLLIYEYI